MVAKLSADAKTKADAAKALATSKVTTSTFRREAMVAVLVLIILCLVFLVWIKRRLDRGARGPLSQAGAGPADSPAGRRPTPARPPPGPGGRRR